jgi:hypothetical protein
MPPTPTARIWNAVAVVVIFLLVRHIAKRVALEVLRD